MTGAPAAGALADVRVVEMGQLLAGPFCGQLLGDLGADVVKIEPPGVGDPMRQWGREKGHELSLWWPVIARNKRSVTLNLRVSAGQDIARRLLEDTDVLIENFRPGTLERWGLSPERLWETNPRLVIVRVTGFGQSGPYSPRAGYGSIGEAMGGLRYVTGDPDRDPSRTGISIGDSLAGTFAALGALAALNARASTGRGQVVDSAIYEAVLAMMECLVTEWDVAGYQRERTGSILPNIAPSNVYPTQDGPMILIGANGDAVFRRLTQVMDQERLSTDPRFAEHRERGKHQAELDELIATWSVNHPSEELLKRLHEGGVPAGRIYRAKEMMTDEHFLARQSIIRVKDGLLGEVAMQNVAPRLSETPGSIRWTGPKLGEHNAEVLGRIGIGVEKLQQLQADSVI
ncbi:MAG: CoA transferase [Acidimicrobiales bacterium]